jgi:hypothetical protein
MERATIHLTLVPALSTAAHPKALIDSSHTIATTTPPPSDSTCTICLLPLLPSTLTATISCCYSATHVACLTPWLTSFLYPSYSTAKTPSTSVGVSGGPERFGGEQTRYIYPPCPTCRAPLDVVSYFQAVTEIASGSLRLVAAKPPPSEKGGMEREEIEREQEDVVPVKRIECAAGLEEWNMLGHESRTLVRRGKRGENKGWWERVVGQEESLEEKDVEQLEKRHDFNRDERWGEASYKCRGWDQSAVEAVGSENPGREYPRASSFMESGQGQRLGAEEDVAKDEGSRATADAVNVQDEADENDQTEQSAHDIGPRTTIPCRLPPENSLPCPNITIPVWLPCTVLDSESRPPPQLHNSHLGRGHRLTSTIDPAEQQILDEVRFPLSSSNSAAPSKQASLCSRRHGVGKRLCDDEKTIGEAGGAQGGVVVKGEGGNCVGGVGGGQGKEGRNKKLQAERRALGLFRGEFGGGRRLDE